MPISEQLKNDFLNLYAIAISDDNVDPREIRYLHDFAKEKGIDEEAVEDLLSNPYKPAVYKPSSLPEKISFLYAAAGMILADGVVEKRERAVFRSICLHLGFLDENIEDLTDFILEAAEKKMPLSELMSIVNETQAP